MLNLQVMEGRCYKMQGPLSDDHHMLKYLFVNSLGRKKFLNNNMGNESLSRDHHDFESITFHGRLDAKKKDPSGKSHVDDKVIESCVDAIASCCSETAWSMLCHCIRPLSVILVKIDAQENNQNESIALPVSHYKVSKAEMFDDCKSSLANNALE